MGLYQTKLFLHCKRNDKQSKTIATGHHVGTCPEHSCPIWIPTFHINSVFVRCDLSAEQEVSSGYNQVWPLPPKNDQIKTPRNYCGACGLLVIKPGLAECRILALSTYYLSFT